MSMRWVTARPLSIFQLGVKRCLFWGEPQALQGPREVRGHGRQKFTERVPGSGAWEEEAVQVQVQGHLGHLGRTQTEALEESFIQDLGWERWQPI